MPTALVIAAAGSGTRLGAGVPKALAPLTDGRPLLDHCLESVAAARATGLGLDALVVLVPPAADHARAVADVVARHETAVGAPVTCVPGGVERADSVRAGLAAADAALADRGHPAGQGVRHVLVHDAARAFTPPAVFEAVAGALVSGEVAAVPGLPLTDTVKEVTGADGREVVVATPARSALRAVQTPQGFDLDVLLAAHAAAQADPAADAAALTDDAMAMEAAGHAVVVVPGDERAFKVTSPADLEVRRGGHLEGPLVPRDHDDGVPGGLHGHRVVRQRRGVRGRVRLGGGVRGQQDVQVEPLRGLHGAQGGPRGRGDDDLPPVRARHLLDGVRQGQTRDGGDLARHEGSGHGLEDRGRGEGAGRVVHQDMPDALPGRVAAVGERRVRGGQAGAHRVGPLHTAGHARHGRAHRGLVAGDDVRDGPRVIGRRRNEDHERVQAEAGGARGGDGLEAVVQERTSVGQRGEGLGDTRAEAGSGAGGGDHERGGHAPILGRRGGRLPEERGRRADRSGWGSGRRAVDVAGRHARAGGSALEDLVQHALGLLLGDLLGQRQLGDEHLAGLGEHALLPRRQAAIVVPAPQVAHDLGHLVDVAAGELLQVRLVAARPVGGLLHMLGLQHLDDVLEALVVHDVPHADQVHVLRGDLDGQVALRHLELEVHLLFALDGARLDLLDPRRTMVGIDDGLSDLENHMKCPFPVGRFYHGDAKHPAGVRHPTGPM